MTEQQVYAWAYTRKNLLRKLEQIEKNILTELTELIILFIIIILFQETCFIDRATAIERVER